MKLEELFKLTGEEPVIKLRVEQWGITAEANALECCLSDKLLEGTVTGIAAAGDTLIVWVDCDDD